MEQSSVVFTRAGLLRGMRLCLPLAIGTFPVGVVYGLAAREAGMGAVYAVLTSALVWSGAAQAAALQLWDDPVPVVAVLVAVAAVSARLLLMGAALRPWLAGLGTARTYGLLAFLADGNWIVTLRAFGKGERDAAILVGGGAIMYVAWVGGTAAGVALGGQIVDPQAWGLDMVFGAFFAALLAGVWRGKGDALPWIAAGVVAVAVGAVAPSWAVPAGTLAGSLAGAARDAV
ncbi:MAG: AzlC family ABC transporter permease [Proteobacteria bacterium]|nr:AzlC family ABC transporter permease [Pseudomonadota bacterium]